jgi:hypothetical protein
VAVPPVAIRPSVEMDGASNEDDITMKLMVRSSSAVLLRFGASKGMWYRAGSREKARPHKRNPGDVPEP